MAGALHGALLHETQLQHQQQALDAASASASAGVAAGAPTLQVNIDQRWVGVVIGQAGEHLRQIRDVTGVSIQIDQTFKEQGYSVAQIYGTVSGAERARQMIEAKVGEVDPCKQAPGAVVEIRVEQSVVGFLLGKGGETLKTIRQDSGASLTIDQSTKESGFSIVKIVGDTQSKLKAQDLVNMKLDEVKPRDGTMSSTGDFAAEFKLEQKLVGWLIGKGGETVKNIKEQSGANVVIDQSSKDQGFSVVRVHHGPGAALAKSLIEAKLAAVQGGGAQVVEEFQIDQKRIGWLIGRGGETVRDIKERSGATMSIDQNKGDGKGCSTVRIGGTAEAVELAKRLVQHKLEELQGMQGTPQDESGLTAAQRSVDRDRSRSRSPRRSRRTEAAPGPFAAVPPPAAGTFAAVPPPSFSAVPPPAAASNTPSGGKDSEGTPASLSAVRQASDSGTSAPGDASVPSGKECTSASGSVAVLTSEPEPVRKVAEEYDPFAS